MVYTNNNSIFPDQVVPEEEKKSFEYGLAVGNAIEQEWFRNNSGQNRFSYNFQNFYISKCVRSKISALF